MLENDPAEPSADSSVLLYSGGVDSYCLAHIYQPDRLLYVDMGTAYGKVEIEHLVAPPGMSDRLVHTSLDLGVMERANRIIPARNAYLVLLAAGYGDRIMMAFTAADVIGDKDERFGVLMTELLGHLWAPQWWVPEGRQVRVELPAKRWTKRQLVGAYLTAGGDAVALARDTISCYATRPGEPVHCGACKACVRKYAAFILNDIDPGYDAGPALRQLVDTIHGGGWRADRNPSERQDMLDAAEVAGAR